MSDTSPTDSWRRFTQEDVLALSIRTALATLGPIGAIIAEFATQLVPRQRVDRLHHYVEQLGDRLTSLEEFKARLHESAAYAALAEEATLAAVRTPSDERRRDLAELLRTGLSVSDADLVGHHALLDLLGRLNEPQLLILMDHGSFEPMFSNPARDAFEAQHPGVFDIHPPSLGDTSDDDAGRWTLHEHYINELVASGLLEDVEGMAKSGSIRKVTITDLGRRLLKAIGR
jgi:hypothetical protein